MAWWLIALAAATAYLIWLSWFDARHRHPWIALAAAVLATVYLGVFTVVAVSPWVSLPLVPTMLVFVVVEIIVRSLHRFVALDREISIGPRYPIENP